MTTGVPEQTMGHNGLDPDWFRVWKQALRLPSFSAALAPILVGAAFAFALGHANLLLLALMIAAAFCCQAGANLANDYFDHRRGVDTAERPGSSTVIQRGLLSPAAVRRGMVVAFTLATLLGLVIVAMTGPAILVLALACLAVAVFYTGGPAPLGYVALGEVAVFLAMGLAIVAGSVLALTGSVTPMAIVIALPNAFLITAILHVNNLRDIDRDRNAGKRTIAMIIGRQWSIRLYLILIVAAYLGVIAIVIVAPVFWPILSVAITAPRAVALVRSVQTARTEQELSRTLRGTNRLLLEFGCLMAVGILVGAAISPQPAAL